MQSLTWIWQPRKELFCPSSTQMKTHLAFCKDKSFSTSGFSLERAALCPFPSQTKQRKQKVKIWTLPVQLGRREAGDVYPLTQNSEANQPFGRLCILKIPLLLSMARSNSPAFLTRNYRPRVLNPFCSWQIQRHPDASTWAPRLLGRATPLPSADGRGDFNCRAINLYWVSAAGWEAAAGPTPSPADDFHPDDK